MSLSIVVRHNRGSYSQTCIMLSTSKMAGVRAVLAAAGDLGLAVFELTVSRFAWTARSRLGADVGLDGSDEDALVEAIVQLL